MLSKTEALMLNETQALMLSLSKHEGRSGQAKPFAPWRLDVEIDLNTKAKKAEKKAPPSTGSG